MFFNSFMYALITERVLTCSIYVHAWDRSTGHGFVCMLALMANIL